jgi:hypothetical protein
MDDHKKDIRALTINLRQPGIELEADIAWSVLGVISENYPELDQYSSDEQKAKFKITKIDKKEKELAYVLISKENISIAVNEIMTLQEWNNYSSNIFNTILDKIKLSPLSVLYIDNQYYRQWETDLHHFRLLFDLFAGESSLRSAFPDIQIAQYNPNITYVLNQDEKIICALNFRNNTSLSTDMLPQYPDKYELLVGSGIAKIGNYKPFTNLNEVLTKIQSYAMVYHDGIIEKYMFKPINDAILSQKQ